MNQRKVTFTLILALSLLITSQAFTKTVNIEFVDHSGLLELNDHVYHLASATKPYKFFCMGYNFYHGYYFYKKASDYFPFYWDEDQNLLYGQIRIQHTLLRKFCKFETDALSLTVTWPLEIDEPHNDETKISIIEDGDSSEVNVYCRYDQTSWGDLRLSCDDAHVAPFKHNQTVIINIDVEEYNY